MHYTEALQWRLVYLKKSRWLLLCWERKERSLLRVSEVLRSQMNQFFRRCCSDGKQQLICTQLHCGNCQMIHLLWYLMNTYRQETGMFRLSFPQDGAEGSVCWIKLTRPHFSVYFSRHYFEISVWIQCSDYRGECYPWAGTWVYKIFLQ